MGGFREVLEEFIHFIWHHLFLLDLRDEVMEVVLSHQALIQVNLLLPSAVTGILHVNGFQALVTNQVLHQFLELIILDCPAPIHVVLVE